VCRFARVIVIDFVYEVIPASSSLAWANEPRMSQLVNRYRVERAAIPAMSAMPRKRKEALYL
jgi:hypothetical protein